MHNGTASNQEISEALERVLVSEEFAGADRLKEFLTYIVKETLEDRGDNILGKRIAHDVYGRDKEEDFSTANVVRVDAGRLRRRLELYYSGKGAQDQIRINVAKGGYVPTFERIESQDVPRKTNAAFETARRNFGKQFYFGLAAAAVAAFAFTLWSISTGENQDAPKANETAQQDVERAILFETSPMSLQARNIAGEARQLFFPATQPSRLLAALLLFEEAIDLDPTYHGGYAGAAQAAALFGGIAPFGPKRDEMLAKAEKYANEALKIGPSEAWSHSAIAILLMFKRDFEGANSASVRAVNLDPTDLRSLEFDAIIAFFSGDFGRSMANTEPDIHEGKEGDRFPWRSVHGNSAFYLGEYDVSINSLLEAATRGEPVSEITAAHLIASLQASDRHTEAREHMEKYKEAWPNSRIEEFMTRLFKDPQNVSALMQKLREAGWSGQKNP